MENLILIVQCFSVIYCSRRKIIDMGYILNEPVIEISFIEDYPSLYDRIPFYVGYPTWITVKVVKGSVLFFLTCLIKKKNKQYG